MRASRRAPATQGGQALVEFALVLPLFVLLVVALIDFSRLLFTYASLVNGARELARTASVVSSTNAQIVAAFNNLTFILGPTQAGIDTVEIDVVDQVGAARGTATCNLPLDPLTCTPPSRTSASGGYVEVEASYRFQFTPLFESVLAGVRYAGFSLPYVDLTTEAKAYLE